MRQPWMVIEAIFATIKVLYCFTFSEGWSHNLCIYIDAFSIHPSMKYLWAPPLTEAQQYSSTVMNQQIHKNIFTFIRDCHSYMPCMHKCANASSLDSDNVSDVLHTKVLLWEQPLLWVCDADAWERHFKLHQVRDSWMGGRWFQDGQLLQGGGISHWGLWGHGSLHRALIRTQNSYWSAYLLGSIWGTCTSM